LFNRRRAPQRALVISLAVASLVLSGEVFGQVRSTIQVQARVVEAGPAWAASDAVREALAAASALSPSYDLSGGRVVLIGLGDGIDRVPLARVTIGTERPTIGADLFSSGGDRVTVPKRSGYVAGVSTSCPLCTDGPARARGALPSTVLPGRDPKPRLVICVEYTSN